ncbi:hypothetical protein [Fodinibius sp. Rm-B-1B1-1]|uniref:hypothetical protein n=1 Tax=Fodinibius alkaliphilus TaxID=3140241 RepID=UPI00315B3DE8
MIHIFLVIHIIAGFAALVTGFIAITTQKGKGWHIYSGRLYFWSMIIVAITAIILSAVRPNLFLLFISLFSFYLTWSGYRAIRWKNNPLPGIAHIFDRLLVPLFFAAGIAMIGLALGAIFELLHHPLLQKTKIIILVFGIIFAALTGRDLALRIGWLVKTKFQWMFEHIQGMLAAYIATFTAFLVVNVTFLPMAVVWLAPTVIGTPVIAYWVRKYKRKFNRPNPSSKQSGKKNPA